MITRIESLRHLTLERLLSCEVTSSTSARSVSALNVSKRLPPSGSQRSQRLLVLNLNFWIALLRLFALFVVLRVLGIVLALRTSPLDNEEDDDKKDDNCEKDPDHDRHQKSIGILIRRVDCVWLF